MRLFPTVHSTVALPEVHRARLESHGVVLVAADEAPDVLLTSGEVPAPDTWPDPSPAAPLSTAAPDAAAAGVVALVGAPAAPALEAQLRSAGIVVGAAMRRSEVVARPIASAGRPTDVDLLAWATQERHDVVATLDVSDAATPFVRVVRPHEPDGAGGSVVVAGGEVDGRRVLATGLDLLTDDVDGPDLLLDAVLWAAPRTTPERTAAVDGEDPAAALVASPAWVALRDSATAIQRLQARDGSIPDPADHAQARTLVATASSALGLLAAALPHDEDYLVALTKDLARWSEGGFEVPDFLDSLVLFHPERDRVDGRRHVVLFPMYTQNGSTERLLEAVLLEVRWPETVARLEATRFTNSMFVPVRFLDFTAGYDTNSAVLFPETVAVREVPAFTWGAIFADREAARFRRVVRAAAETTRLALPPDAERLLADQRLAEETFVLWDVVHDRTHMRGDLPFDPFMIKQRMPYFLYSLEELRCDLTAFRAAVALEADGVPHARYVQYAIVFDRIFRFPVTGSRVRNYDGLGGQLLFAWLHQHHVLDWTDSRLTIDWPRVPEAVIALAERIEQLYWRSIDRPKTAHWLAAYALVSETVTPHPASVWARGPEALPLDGPPRGLTDAVLDDEFPLSMFYEALARKIGDVVASTSGITA